MGRNEHREPDGFCHLTAEAGSEASDRIGWEGKRLDAMRLDGM